MHPTRHGLGLWLFLASLLCACDPRVVPEYRPEAPAEGPQFRFVEDGVDDTGVWLALMAHEVPPVFGFAAQISGNGSGVISEWEPNPTVLGDVGDHQWRVTTEQDGLHFGASRKHPELPDWTLDEETPLLRVHFDWPSEGELAIRCERLLIKSRTNDVVGAACQGGTLSSGVTP